MPGTVVGLAVGDFRDRVRRPAYAVVLIAAVGLGYLATPAPESEWVVMQVGDYRGTYNSAYTGMVVALAATVWLPLGGFYVVRNALARDEATGVGRLLATTPLRTWTYLVAKFLSSVLVLASMLGVLAVTALVMQWARGETMAVDPVRLLSPFVYIALPLMACTAAAALLFETIPLLRAGLGNVLWFFVWTVLVLAGQSPEAPLGGIGVHGVVQSLGAGLAEQGVDPGTAGEFSLGLTQIQEPLKTFDWQGFDPDPAFLLGRCALVALALGLALLPALWFPRFDPARGRGTRAAAPGLLPRSAGTGHGGAVPVGAGAPAGSAAGVRDADLAVARPAAFAHPPRTSVTSGSPALRLLVGEVRILLQGTPLWWWAGVLVLVVVSQSVTPATGVTRILLPAAWIWPVLIWSRLGTQRHEHGVEALLGAYPAVRGRTAAEWDAGFLLTAAAGLGPALRMVTGADTQGLVHWFLGALFIPSLALLLGTLSRTHRLFQFTYLPLWYGTVNGLAAVDFMGAIRGADGSPAGPPPVFLAVAVVMMLSVVFLSGAARRATS
ncbi:ABC transporter permease [Streptomyces sp. AA1529]|uniref:ABC transporter permease n=1 Tax=Streptomyces sp. AA1529 TaxID=1203257 RepID=UPI00031B40BC|nr:hypothetical protein [Streptomyces sp. AA1529]